MGAAAQHKSGFVSLVGRPNSGKSTLLNQLVGTKISIVTPSPQTTRNVVRGIAGDERGQVVFLDTPGIHKPLHTMNRRMMRFSLGALEHVDIVLLLLDASASAGGGDAFVLELIRKVPSKRFLLLNKIDRIRKQELLPLISRHQDAGFDAILPVSALTGEGLDELKAEIFGVLPEGPAYYPGSQLTDQPERFVVAEMIREKLILMTREELPHATAVSIERFEEGERLIRIHAGIFVERESQKPIVIGKAGSMLKRIGIAARKDIEALLDRRVHLELHVKVRRKWRDDEQVLEALGI
jgi:GTP-binding protein Era